MTMIGAQNQKRPTKVILIPAFLLVIKHTYIRQSAGTARLDNHTYTRTLTIRPRLRHFKNGEMSPTLTVLLNEHSILKTTIFDGRLFHTLIIR